MKIKLELEQEAINKILFLLAREPFNDVVDLINDIHKQANPQLDQG